MYIDSSQFMVLLGIYYLVWAKYLHDVKECKCMSELKSWNLTLIFTGAVAGHLPLVRHCTPLSRPWVVALFMMKGLLLLDERWRGANFSRTGYNTWGLWWRDFYIKGGGFCMKIFTWTGSEQKTPLCLDTRCGHSTIEYAYCREGRKVFLMMDSLSHLLGGLDVWWALNFLHYFLRRVQQLGGMLLDGIQPA